MSISGSTITRTTATRTTPTRTTPEAHVEIPAARIAEPLAGSPEPDYSCWRMLTSRVPLTLLLDLALPSAEALAEAHEEMLAETSSIDWIVAPRKPLD